MTMTYNLSPRLFIENGPTVLNRAALRHREMLRILLASESGGSTDAASLPPPANSDSPLCGAVRFAL